MDSRIFAVTCLILATFNGAAAADIPVACGTTTSPKPGDLYKLQGSLSATQSCEYIFKTVANYKVVFKCSQNPHTTASTCGTERLLINDNDKCILQPNQRVVSKPPQARMKIKIEATTRALTYNCEAFLELDPCDCGLPKREQPKRQRSDALLFSATNASAVECGAIIASPKVLVTSVECANKLQVNASKVEVGTGTTSKAQYTVTAVHKMTTYNATTQAFDVAVLLVDPRIILDENVGTACIQIIDAIATGDDFNQLADTLIRDSISMLTDCAGTEVEDNICRKPKGCQYIKGSGVTLPYGEGNSTRSITAGLTLNRNCETEPVAEQGFKDQTIRDFIKSYLDTAICKTKFL